MVKRTKAISLMEEYISVIGLTPCRETDDTPRRIVDMHLNEFTSMGLDKIDFKFTTFPNAKEYDQLIVVSAMPLRSFCAHHLLPWHGLAHVGYLPEKRIVGLSKIPRVIEFFSNKPTSQEPFTEEVATFLFEELNPQALFVSIRASHSCMTCRGIKSVGSYTTTTSVKGPKALVPQLKKEFFDTVGLHTRI